MKDTKPQIQKWYERKEEKQKENTSRHILIELLET